MKAISLWQPWASYIAVGMKRFETRHWSTSYRGPLAIHAAKRRLTEDEQYLLEDYPLPAPVFPLGAIVATCELVDCIRMTDALIANRERRELCLGNWEPGRFAWALIDVIALSAPIPMRGRQGLFDLDEQTLRAVKERLA